MRISIGVLTVTGTLDSSESPELVASAAARALSQAGYERVIARSANPEEGVLRLELLNLCETCDIVFTAGGSGFGEKDVVPEVTASILEKRADGLMELIRTALHKRSDTSYLNRGIAGIRGRTVIVNLPATAETVKESIEALSLLIRPMMSALRGSTAVQDVV